MRTTVRFLILGLGLAAFGAVGCRRQTERVVTTAGPSLPEWAPKQPSAAFLRAARELITLPPEEATSWGRNLSSQCGGTDTAYAVRLQKTWITDWEFFATLTDAQLKKLQSVGQIWIPDPVAVAGPARGARPAVRGVAKEHGALLLGFRRVGNPLPIGSRNRSLQR